MSRKKKSLIVWIPAYEYSVMKKAGLLPCYFIKPKIGESVKVKITVEEMV
jgi:hypothetical protein